MGPNFKTVFIQYQSPPYTDRMFVQSYRQWDHMLSDRRPPLRKAPDKILTSNTVENWTTENKNVIRK